MSKVGLIIIYNHQYNDNIDVIEEIYKDRFSHIYHLMPFYSGQKDNVIAVYESSHYFQGYISQGLKSFFDETFVHYLFIADDVLLNPQINENNYHEFFKLNPTSSFLPAFINLHNVSGRWRGYQAYEWSIECEGVEATDQLLDYDEAKEKFQQHGLDIKPLLFHQAYHIPHSIMGVTKAIYKDKRFIFYYIASKLFKTTYHLSYPVVGGYPDIFIVNNDAIKQFSHYCGVFAATQLFVELAIPTALALCAKNIITEEDLTLKGKVLWSKELYQELEQYNNSLSELFSYCSKECLYIHPIKLSQWK